MRFRFRCPNCNFKYRVRIDQAGKPGRCKRCDAILRVPKLDPNFASEATAEFTTATVEIKIGGALGFIRRILGLDMPVTKRR
jgi:hypothetical protein